MSRVTSGFHGNGLFCIVFMISIQYESINLPFYTEMDDENDIKGKLSVLYIFLSYRPSFLYSFNIDKVNFLILTKRYDKFIFFC